MIFRRILLAAGALLLMSLVMVTFQRETSSSSGMPERSTTSPSHAIAASSDGSRTLQFPKKIPRQILENGPARRDVEGQPALTPPRPGELSTTDRSPLANRLGGHDTKPEAESGIVLDLLKTYRRLFGAYPAGEGNQQFVNALLGANKDNLPLLPADHPRINHRGEIVDAWGTPFFFHQNSRTSVEVRSAGPDHAFYTGDDIVAGKSPASLGEPLISSEEF